MDDDREAYEFAYALYLAREVGRDVADLIAQAAEAWLFMPLFPIQNLANLAGQSFLSIGLGQ